MGQFKKDDPRRNQKISSSYSYGKNRYEREYWFSIPKEKAKILYHFFKKWAPEIYGDVDDIRGCEVRGLEPLSLEDYEIYADDSDGQNVEPSGTESNDGNNPTNRSRWSYLRISSQEKTGSSSTSPNHENDATKNRQKFWRRSPLHFLKLVEDHFSTDGLSTEWNVR